MENSKAYSILEPYLPSSPESKEAFIEGYRLALESQGGTLEDIHSHSDYPGPMGRDGSRSETYNTLMEYHRVCCPFKETCTYSAGPSDCTELCEYQRKFGELISKI